MTTYFYVAEPDVIDLKIVEELMHSHNIQLVDGTSEFAASSKHPYEVLLIRSKTTVDDRIKTQFPHLKSIIRVGTGLDNIDIEYCKSVGIEIYNAAGANAGAVAEYIITMTLYLLRRLNHLTKEDLLEWNRFKFRGQSLDSQTLGLIGFGNIGRAVSRMATSFNCPAILTYDPFVSQKDLPSGVTKTESLDELLQACSIISLQVPLTKATRGLLNKERLRVLKPETIVVNVSHGGVVDEAAVIECLDEDASAFTYVADTVENEPHGDQRLFDHENVIITPHIASLTYSSEREMVRVAIQNYLDKKVAL